MAEIQGPDLSSIKPVDDMEASRYLSAETHRWLRDSVVIDERVGQVGLTAKGERLQRPRDALRPHKGRRESDSRGTPRRVLLATLLFATVAAVIALLPGLLSNDGSVTQPAAAQAQILHRITTALARKPETILVQEMRMQIMTTEPVAPHQPTFGPVTSLTIDEASHDGAVQRSFSTSSELRPGFEQLSANNSLQIYDPSDDTIYETTPAAWQAAVQRHIDGSLPKGSGGTTSTFSYSGRDSTGPGRMSVFDQRLRQHLYRLAGRTSVDGRSALKLVPLRTSIRISATTANGSAREFLGTVYVSATTYYPIKEVTRVPSTGSPLGTAPGSVTTIVNDWSEYRVLPVTTKNARLLSLTARHPHAQIVRSADAYLRVSDTESHR